MGYDLYLWPADRALTWAEAEAELERGDGGSWLRLGHDKRLDPFLDALRRRYPGIGQGPDGPPVEVDVHRRHVVLGIGWPMVEELVPVVSEIAHRTGLAVIDPQREVVGLPAPLADTPLGPDGLDDHVRSAEGVLGAITGGSVASPQGDGNVQASDDETVAVGDEVAEPGDGEAADPGGHDAAAPGVSDQLRAIGASTFSPLGFQITPDIEAEALADPTRVPASLQTPDWRDELLAGLRSPKSPDRHRALITLGGWGHDDAVARALRPLLASDDIAEAGLAAGALARQGDITDLPAILGLVHRCSPDDGGTVEAMLLPLSAALDLARAESPMVVTGVKDRARQWRGMPAARRRTTWAGDADAALDALLAD